MARTPLLATLAAVLLIASVPGSAHPGETDATHLCPDVATLYAHVHGSGDDRYFWMDTQEDSPHADTGSPYSGGSEGGAYTLTLEPALAHAVLLNQSERVVVVVHGQAQTSSAVFPGPVQDVFDAIGGVEQVPGPVKDAIEDIRDDEVQNVGSGDATIRATLRAGPIIIGSGQASAEVTHTPPSTLERAPFDVEVAFEPRIAMVEPSFGNVTLTLERLEPLAWDIGTVRPMEPPADPGPETVAAALQGPAGQTRVDLPILDHATGPLCPEWDLAPLEASSDAPKQESRAPGQFFEFSVSVTNPERLAQNVTLGFADVDRALEGTFHNANAGDVIVVEAYESRMFNARVTVADGATPGTASINVTATGDNLSFGRVITVTVVEPEPQPDPSDDSPSEDGQNASVPADEPPAGDAENGTGLEAEAGGRSPAFAVMAAVGALALAAGFKSRRR
jgi:hypothetical protein